MNQIRPRKVPLPNLDRAAYLERDTAAEEVQSTNAGKVSAERQHNEQRTRSLPG